MMDNNYFIRDYCVIRDCRISHNGTTIFQGADATPAGFFMESYKFLEINYPKFHKMDPLCKLGFLASEVISKAQPADRQLTGEDTGIILFNAASSIDADRNHQQSINDRNAYFPSPSVFVYTLANIVIGEICIRNKIYGEGTFFIEEKFHAGRMFEYVKLLLDEGIVRRCITGWIQTNGNQYEGLLFLVEKSSTEPTGITIFNTEKLNEIYSLRT